MIDEKQMREIIFPRYKVTEGYGGLTHIKHVVHFGRLISQTACPKNMYDVLLGCYLHDIGRGYTTPGITHGDAGAPIAREILEENFGNADIERIVAAVQNHDKGKLSSDVVVGCIWDADRVSLFRIGRVPDPNRLSTQAGIDLIPYAEIFIKEHLHEY